MKIENVAVCALLGVALSVSAGDNIPRMPDGKPDFSGTYDIASLTPFQRSTAQGDNLYLSDDHVGELEKAAADEMAAGDAPSDPDRAAPEKGADVGFYNYAWLDMGDSLFKVDGRYRSSILVDPPNGRMPPLTEAGQARRDAGPSPRGAQPQDQNQIEPPDDLLKNDGTAWWLDEGGHPYDDPELLPLLDRCILYAGATIPMMPTMYNNMKTVVQTDSHVLINIEWMHWARIVRLDSEHVHPEIRSLAGDSIGSWEGDTLVVETTNFLEKPGVPWEGLRIVERFTPIDEDTLLYKFTVHDPDYTAPYSGELPWPKSDQKSYEYACHEGNYAMGNILRGARQLERDWFERHASTGRERAGQ